MDETITNAAQQELNAEQTAPAETAAQDAPAEEAAPETASAPAENAAPENTNTAQEKRKGFRFTKKTAISLGAVLLVVIIAAIILTPSKFERVENKCIHIAGQAGNGKNYFTLDTYPDSYSTWTKL